VSVECPARECGFQGTLDAVEGHIGGVNDALHQQVVVSDLREMLHGEASEGGFWTPTRVLLLAVLVVLAAAIVSGGDGRVEDPGEEDETDA